MSAYKTSYRCRDCKHDKGKCVGFGRTGPHYQCFEQKIYSNADRIRSMSDEELAKTLAYGDVFYEEICGSDERTRVCDNDCMACALEWLQQPAKE